MLSIKVVAGRDLSCPCGGSETIQSPQERAALNSHHCRLSSVVEQRFCKAKVIGSNPLAGFNQDL